MRKKVSMMLAIQDAMDAMDMKETNDIPVFMDWVKKAEDRIGSIKTFKKYIEVLDIVHCKAQLPMGVVQVKSLILGDHGCNCMDLFDRFILTVTPMIFSSKLGLVVIDSNNSTSQKDLTPSSVEYAVQDDMIIFASDNNVDRCTVLLESYYLDENNAFPLINENHVDAVSMFIQLMQARRSRWKPKKKMITVDLNYLDSEWHRLCADARAEDARQTDREKEDTADIMNNPMSGYGFQSPNRNINYPY